MKRILPVAMALFGMQLMLGKAFGQSNSAPDPLGGRSEYAFGMHLFQAGDYYRAISAFKRQAFFGPDSTAHAAQYMIPVCEYAAGRYGEALAGFNRFSKQSDSARLREASDYYQGCCWLLLGQHGAAESTFGAASFADPALRERAAFARGWAQLLAGEWTTARASLLHYAQMFPQAAGRPLAERIADELAKAPRFGQKRELWGLLFSVVPGGGQLYGGRRGDALYSALLVGASALMAVRGAREDSNFTLSFGVALTTSLYLGSAYGGVNAVRDHNSRQWQSALRSYEAELPASIFDEYVLP